jgi:hypothetical protein
MPSGAEGLIQAWERRLLRILQDSELDTKSPDVATSPTLRSVANALKDLPPEQYDHVAYAFEDVGPLGQVWCFGTALGRVLDHLAPPDPRRGVNTPPVLDLEELEDP